MFVGVGNVLQWMDGWMDGDVCLFVVENSVTLWLC
jgi:hypothetical protein